MKIKDADIHASIDGLDYFAKHYCMDVEETIRTNDLVFRCHTGCPFLSGYNICLIKKFAYDNDNEYATSIDFGCMGVRKERCGFYKHDALAPEEQELQDTIDKLTDEIYSQLGVSKFEADSAVKTMIRTYDAYMQKKLKEEEK